MMPRTMRRATRPTRSQRMRAGAARRAAAWARAMFGHSGAAWKLLPAGGADRLRAKHGSTWIRGVMRQRLLDPKELVVLRHAVRARRRARLDLPAPSGHGQVRD